MFIDNSAPPRTAVVTITTPSSSPQTRVAFNAPLVREARLESATHLAVHYDPETRSVTFIGCNGTYPGTKPFPLMPDGGHTTRKTLGRAIYLRKKSASQLVAGKYPAETKQRRGSAHIKIHLDPIAVEHQSANDVPMRFSGVYKVLAGDGIAIDIGCSSSDVRARLRTKWGSEPEAASLVVYALGSVEECLHWEKTFQRRHLDRFGELPRYCTVMGKGCACVECRS